MNFSGTVCFKGDKPKDPPPPLPIPKNADTNEAVDQAMTDQRRFRRGFLSSTIAGETGSSGTGGASFLG